MSVCQGSPAYMVAELLLGLCSLRYTCFSGIYMIYIDISIYTPKSLIYYMFIICSIFMYIFRLCLFT